MSETGSPADRARGPGPTVVGVILPPGLITRFADKLDSVLGGAGEATGPVEVHLVPWQDTPPSRRLKLRPDASRRAIRAREQPLTTEARASLAACDVVIAIEAPLELVAMAPALRFVQSFSAGVNPLIGVLRRTHVPLCSSAGMSGDKVAEFALARLFAVWTDQRTLEVLQRSRRWAPETVSTVPIGGRTVLVVGTGGIGQAVARRAGAFDLRVIGVRRRPELGAPEGFDRVVGPEQLADVLAEADAVIIAAPATPKTSHLIGTAELEVMRPGAVLCNVARGSLVDEDAVVGALRSGRLGAAILDVTEHEPLSRASPLWRAPNAYLSPHTANTWRPGYIEAVVGLLVENLARDRAGLPLRNVVDLDEGY